MYFYLGAAIIYCVDKWNFPWDCYIWNGFNALTELTEAIGDVFRQGLPPPGPWGINQIACDYREIMKLLQNVTTDADRASPLQALNVQNKKWIVLDLLHNLNYKN